MSQFWQRAREAADEAAVLYEARLFNGASSRAYYAMFNAARALLSRGPGIAPEKVKTHASVLRLFSQNFVQTGAFRAETARFLAKASETRRTADYGGIPIGSDEAREVLAAMQEFMATARSILEAPKPVS